MKAGFTSLCLFTASAVFAIPDDLKASEVVPLFQSYLATCEDTENQPVHLRNASQEKETTFTEMTILDLAAPSLMQIEAVAERILYADVDVVHLANASAQGAACLYDMLQGSYSHFIHVPNKERGLFIASKYPLSRTAIILSKGENGIGKKALEFAIHGANTFQVSVCLSHGSMRLGSLENQEEGIITPIFLIDVPGTLTVMKQWFSPLKLAQKIDSLAAGTFQLIPIKHRGGSNDKGGYKGEVDVGYSWGGKEGGHWEGSARFEAHDDHGNYMEAEVKQNDKGEGSANARAGHEEK